MARTNREILTGGKKYAQKQKAKHRVEEVVFDKDARKEYLTGFHKRKVERQKKAQVYNQEQERLARIEERKRVRDEKKEDIARQLDLYNNKLKDLRGVVSDSEDGSDKSDNNESDNEVDEDEEWNGFEDEEDQDNDREAEEKANEVRGILKRKELYTSTPLDTEEDQVTTVTIESLEPNADNLEIIAKSNFVDLTKSREILEESIDRAKRYAAIAGEAKPKNKLKKKKFRYLTKNERRDNVRKERGKNNRKRDSKDTKK